MIFLSVPESIALARDKERTRRPIIELTRPAGKRYYCDIPIYLYLAKERSLVSPTIIRTRRLLGEDDRPIDIIL